MKKDFKSSGFRWIVIFSFMAVNMATATTYYVDPFTGNDINNGTSSSTPWKTLKAIQNHQNQFVSGDADMRLVHVHPDRFHGEWNYVLKRQAAK